MSEKIQPVGSVKVWDGEKKEWGNQLIYPGDLYKETLGYFQVGRCLLKHTPMDADLSKELPEWAKNILAHVHPMDSGPTEVKQ